MKANEAPKKIYLYPSDRAGEEYEDEWGTFPWCEDYVEYTRTDAFIEKACDWINLHIGELSDIYTRSAIRNEFLEDFRKAMEE